MAETFTNFLEAVALAKEIADDAKALGAKVDRLLKVHNKQDYSGVNSDPAPAWLNKDSHGNIDGHLFGPVQYLNLVNYCNQYKNLLGGQSVEQGDYQANIEAVAEA